MGEWKLPTMPTSGPKPIRTPRATSFAALSPMHSSSTAGRGISKSTDPHESPHVYLRYTQS